MYVRIFVTFETMTYDWISYHLGVLENYMQWDRHTYKKSWQEKLQKNGTLATWHVTCETWNVTHDGGWTFSQNFISPGLTVWDWQFFKDSEQKIQTIKVQWATCAIL